MAGSGVALGVGANEGSIVGEQSEAQKGPPKLLPSCGRSVKVHPELSKISIELS